jgi:hypothetical protein
MRVVSLLNAAYIDLHCEERYFPGYLRPPTLNYLLQAPTSSLQLAPENH